MMTRNLLFYISYFIIHVQNLFSQVCHVKVSIILFYIQAPHNEEECVEKWKACNPHDMECILRVAKECGKIFSDQFLSNILAFLYFDFIDTKFAQRNIILIGLVPIPMNGQGRQVGKC